MSNPKQSSNPVDIAYEEFQSSKIGIVYVICIIVSMIILAPIALEYAFNEGIDIPDMPSLLLFTINILLGFIGFLFFSLLCAIGLCMLVMSTAKTVFEVCYRRTVVDAIFATLHMLFSLAIAAVAIFSLYSNTIFAKEKIETTSYTVYITETGSKYHTRECHHLQEGWDTLSLHKAWEQEYEACSKCDPPAYEDERYIYT